MNDIDFNVSFTDPENLDIAIGDEESLAIGFSGSTKGDPGFSPIANVVKEGNVATITITDKTGTTTAEIRDGSAGTMDHSELENRDIADQHPKSAITGLEADLLSRPDTAITDAEILNL